jgi:hypothetical protein
VNAKGFFVSTLTSAIDLGVATGDDILRHVTPTVLAASLPRPLWARLLTACVGTSGIDAQVVVETIGVANLCEHVPMQLLWQCLSDIAAKMTSTDDGAYRPPVTQIALTPAPPAPAPAPAPLPAAPVVALLAPAPAATTPPPAPAALPSSPSIPAPLADLVAEIEADDRPLPGMARSRTTSQRFRPGGSSPGTGSGIGRPAPTAPLPQPRRPQAAAAASVIEQGTSRARRSSVDPAHDYDIETDVRQGGDWRAALTPETQPGSEPAAVDVDDEQLVDWASSEETVTGGDGLGIGRKR